MSQLQFLVATSISSFFSNSIVAFCHSLTTDQVILFIFPNSSKCAWMASLEVPKGISLINIDLPFISNVLIGEIIVASISRVLAFSIAYFMLWADVKVSLKWSGMCCWVMALWNSLMLPNLVLISLCFSGTVLPDTL